MTKRNHVVPKKYLWWFRITDLPDVRRAIVWMYDRMRKKWIEVPVGDAAVRKHYYREEDEVGLADKVEYPAQHPLEKLRIGHQISFEDRLKVAWYVYAMMVRVPMARDLARRTIDEQSEQWVKQTIDRVRAAHQFADIPISEQREEMLRKLVNDVKADPTALPYDLYDDMVGRVWYDSDSGEAPRMVRILAHLAWRIVFADKRQNFITSDNPVHVFSLQMGSDDPRFELVFRLSSNCSLHSSRQGYPGMLEVVRDKPRLVRALNVRVLSRAERFVYSSSQERWIAKSIHRPPSLFRMPAINWGHDQLINGFYRERVCERCGVPFTKNELDSADITYRGEKTADGVMLEEVKTIPHICQR